MLFVLFFNRKIFALFRSSCFNYKLLQDNCISVPLSYNKDMDKKTIIAQGHVQSIGQQIQLLICCSFCETIWCHKLPKYKPTLYMHYNISLLASYFVKEMILTLISICNNNPNHDLNHIDLSIWPPRNFSLHQTIKYSERA